MRKILLIVACPSAILMGMDTVDTALNRQGQPEDSTQIIVARRMQMLPLIGRPLARFVATSCADVQEVQKETQESILNNLMNEIQDHSPPYSTVREQVVQLNEESRLRLIKRLIDLRHDDIMHMRILEQDVQEYQGAHGTLLDSTECSPYFTLSSESTSHNS